MKLIDPNEIKFVIAPIAPILIGEQVHFERVAFQQDVRQIRKIEAEPVKHGKWIPYESETGEGSNTYKCSACGEIQMLIEGTSKENGWKYCPNCGALMDGEIEGKRKK